MDASSEKESREADTDLRSEASAIREGPLSIRGLDYGLYIAARAQAIRERKNIGAWLNEAIRAKLQQTGTRA